MADSDKKDEKDNDVNEVNEVSKDEANEVPKAEADEVKDNKDDDNDDTKDDEKNSSEPVQPKRIPKKDPGNGLPEKTPDVIEFRWNKNFTAKKQCDTLHFLFLLSKSLELVRLRTIERNKYFASIGRTDRFISHLDNPQIITNFLDWHNKDKEKNKFDGPLYDTAEKLFMINDMISEIGGVKKGPATKIFHKLWKDVVIQTTAWTAFPQPKLELPNWGYTKMYKGEILLEECTLDQMITLLTYVNPEPFPEFEQKEDKENIYKLYYQGVLQFMSLKLAKKPSHLMKEENWKEKIIEFFKKEQLDGKKFHPAEKKPLCQQMMNHVKDPSILNDKKKPANNLLRGGCNMVIKELGKVYVDGILNAAKAQAANGGANNQESQPKEEEENKNDE